LSLAGLPVSAPVTLYACYSPNNATFYLACGTVTLQLTAPQTPPSVGVVSITPTTATSNAVLSNVALKGSFGTSPTNPVIAFSKVPGQCPLADLMLQSQVTVSGSGSSQTATISSLNLAPAGSVTSALTLYPCYAPDGGNFRPSPNNITFTILPPTAPLTITDLDPSTLPAGSAPRNVAVSGKFGTPGTRPTIAFSTVPNQCPLASLMLMTPLTSVTATVCFTERLAAPANRLFLRTFAIPQAIGSLVLRTSQAI
jgi:hypothetical protein